MELFVVMEIVPNLRIVPVKKMLIAPTTCFVADTMDKCLVNVKRIVLVFVTGMNNACLD